MIIIKFIVFIIVFLLKLTRSAETSSSSSSSSSFDSIISSQCKTKCLSLYPWSTMDTVKRFNRQQQQQTEQIKWHKVMELCAKNTICLQCSLPCDIPKYLLENCKYLCKNRHSSCIDSCNLLTRLNEEKYGTCSSREEDDDEGLVVNRSVIDDVTQASVMTTCSKDSDCEDMQKCCNFKCQKPVINDLDLDLPSVPYNLTIIERKKGKTVILSWQASYQTSKPTMFVVEGRWSLNYDQNSLNIDQQMTKWGYLAQTVNNNWIILRNIHRGRWYRFRVAAISSTGTYGYSQPTDLFILSAAPKPPSVPQNLTMSVSGTLNETHVDIKLAWLPPKRSDLPLASYKIIVYKIVNTTKMSAKQNINEITDDELKYENEIILNEVIKSSQISYQLEELNINYYYLIELFAISELTIDRQLVSTPVKLLVNLKQTEHLHDDHLYDEEYPDAEIDLEEEDNNIPSSTTTTTTTATYTTPTLRNLTLQNVYFQNGLVRARLSWQVSQQPLSASSDYQLTWFPIKCLDSNGTLVKQHQLPAPISAQTQKLQYEIYELKFNCDYVVNVKLINQRLLQATKRPIYSSVQFKVPMCRRIEIVGKIKPLCYEDDDDEVLEFPAAATEEPIVSTQALTSSKWIIFNEQSDENNVLSRHEINSAVATTTTTPATIISIKSASILHNRKKEHQQQQQHQQEATARNYTLLSPSSLLNYFYYKPNDVVTNNGYSATSNSSGRRRKSEFVNLFSFLFFFFLFLSSN